jgi:hypothetical protein
VEAGAAAAVLVVFLYLLKEMLSLDKMVEMEHHLQ